MVYEDAEQLYAEVHKDGHRLLNEAFDVLFSRSFPLSPATPSKTSGHSGTIIAFNTTFFPRMDVVEVPLSGSMSQLKSRVVQTSKDGTTGYALMDCSKGGSCGPSTVPTSIAMPVSGVE